MRTRTLVCRVFTFALLLATMTVGMTTSGASGVKAGDLDPSFDIDGKVTTIVGTGEDYASAVAIQTDGKVVVAGYASNGTNDDFAVVRYNSDGSLDTTFGDNCKVVTDFGRHDQAYGVALQPDGKIVVVGNSASIGGVFAVARYNTNGSLDTSFGNGGKVTTDIGSCNDGAYKAVIQSDGKIVVAGETDNCVPTDFAVVRYNTDGSLDTTLGAGGVVVTAFGPGYDQCKSDVLLQADGKIILTGWVDVGSQQYDFALARYNGDGRLDTTFGLNGDGRVTTDMGTAYDGAWGAVLQPDGKIILAGWREISNSVHHIAMARYASNGSLDPAFGSGGKVFTDLGGIRDMSSGIALQPDGKIVLGGWSDGDFAVLRYNSNGSLDSTFGTGGYVLTDLEGGEDYGTAVAIQADGQIVVAGVANYGSNADFAVARYFGTGNAVPVVIADQPSVTVDEGQTATNTGTVSDLDNDPATLSASVGTVINNGNGRWSWSFLTSDGPSDSQTVTISADDGHGGLSQALFELAVNNVAPSVGAITAPTGPVPVHTGFNVNAGFSDPGVLDTHTAVWDWGDGTTSDGTVSETNGSGSVSGSHIYLSPGVYTIKLTVTDKDGGSADSVVSVAVIPQLTVLNLAGVWIGLKNSDDVGTRFDLRAEVYQNGTTLIATGELDSVWGGSSGFNNARLNTIPLTLIGPVGWPEGSTLTFKRNLSKNRGKLAGRLTKRINTLLHAFYVYVISEPS